MGDFYNFVLKWCSLTLTNFSNSLTLFTQGEKSRARLALDEKSILEKLHELLLEWG